MSVYDDLIRKLRCRRVCLQSGGSLDEDFPLMREAADAIEKLLDYEAFYRELTEQYKKLGQELIEKCPRWVPVMERLPEECGRFIVLLKASEDETKRWAEWGLGDDADIILEMLYDADQKIWKTEYGAYNAVLSVVNREHDSCVTHWMPLPAPPEGA